MKVYRRLHADKYLRCKRALERLEYQYEKFKEAGEDKQSWTSTRKGYKHTHSGVPFEKECQRMKKEIDALKSKIGTYID